MDSQDSLATTTPDKAIVLQDNTSETALRVLVSTQIDKAIATARAYPRNEVRAVDVMTAMATRTMESADASRYRKPIGNGKFAEGGSIRLAEIVAVCWGNLRIDPPAVQIGERHVEAHVLCHDLQTNVTFSGSCSKSIMYSKKGDRAGRRFGDDQIAVSTAAAIATAKRNAILVTVPRVFWEPILAQCRQVVAGQVRDLHTSVRTMLGHFATLGIDEQRVLASIDRKAIEEITPGNVADLRSTAAAIKTGDLSLAEAFPEPETIPEGATKLAPHAAVDAALGDLAEPKSPQPAPKPSEPPKPPPAAERPAQADSDAPAATEKAIGMASPLFKRIRAAYNTLTEEGKSQASKQLGIERIEDIAKYSDLDARDAEIAIESMAALGKTAT